MQPVGAYRGQILLIGAVRGLISEGNMVKKAFTDLEPDIVGLSISKESIQAMTEHFKEGKQLPEPANFEEEMYIEGFSEFGEVVRPPPCFSEAWKMAVKNNVPVKGLDMDDEHFTSAFCKYVSTLDMVRQGRCEKRWARHGFIAKTPAEFVVEWDRVINWLPGYQNLEKAREEWIAKGICQLAKKYDKVLIVVELERLAGVQDFLREMDCNFQTPESES